MRPWSTRWPRPLPPPEPSSPARRAAVGVALAAATGLGCAAALGLGCVSVTAYDELAAERDRLAAENERLRTSTQSLDRSRVEAMDELEDLRLSRVRLEDELRTLTARIGELEGELREREDALRVVHGERLGAVQENLARELAPELATERVRLAEEGAVLAVELDEEVAFAPGSSELRPLGRGVLERVALELYDESVPLALVVEPEGSALGGERRAAMARALIRAGIAPERLAPEADAGGLPQVELRLALPPVAAPPPVGIDAPPPASRAPADTGAGRSASARPSGRAP